MAPPLNLLLPPVISPLTSLLVNKAADALIEQFCTMHNMTEKRKKLHRYLLAINGVIASAESRAEEPLVKAWLEKLSATAYQAVDVLDEFQYQALRQQDDRQKPSSFFNKATEFILPDKIPFSCKMSMKLNNVLKKINKIITEMNQFSFISSKADDPQHIVKGKPTHSSDIEIESEIIIGRGDDKDYMLNMLLDHDRKKYNVSVLPIVGMGGVGKTTLAQMVYKEKKVMKHFKLRIWVCVSKVFEVDNIAKCIIEVVENQRCKLTTREALKDRLRKVISKEICLLVLDDIWNEDKNKWDELKNLLLSSDFGSGSVIIVTTRSKNAASIMGTLPPRHLAVLSEEDSWKLFRKRAFGVDEPEEQLVSLGRKIVRKCAGLPLALQTIGALMINKRDVSYWRAISENKIWNITAGSDEVLPALKLSYDYLPGYIKQCFAFCAIFPQDYEIEKETIIQLWIANDFIPTDEHIDLEHKGQNIFETLCERSFFQEFNLNSYGTYELTKFKMHDLMHDLAKHITKNQCDSVHYFSISPHNHLNCILQAYPVQRTCLLSGASNIIVENKILSHLARSTPLRALAVINIYSCPKEVGYMKHLRYLDLSNGNFHTLPKTISALYNLQTLKLSASKIFELPDDMRYMTSLRHLFINFCDNLKRMPVGLGQLKSLKTLTDYIVQCEPGRTIRELNQLHLCGFLNLSGLENVKDINEAIAANMISKTGLSTLTLKWGIPNDTDLTRNDIDVLNGLRPHNELRSLNVIHYAGNDFPNWMNKSVLKNIKKLVFSSCINCTTLPPVWCLPLLEELHLSHLKSLLYICNSQGIEGDDSKSLLIFANLKELQICDLNNLKGWHEKDDKLVAFPRLTKLTIDNSPEVGIVSCAPLLQKLTINNSRKIKLSEISNMNMIALSHMTIFYPDEPGAFRPPKNVVDLWVGGFWNVIPLEEDDKEDYQNMTLRHLHMKDCICFFTYGPSKVALGFWKYFASLETLWIESCQLLSTWPEEEFRSLKYLKSLAITRCDNFTGLSQAAAAASSSSSSDGKDFLPQLEKLIFSYCPKLVEIPKCSKSLKSLFLQGCPVLLKEGLNWLTNLHELQQLTLKECKDLKSLPEGLECLTSLRRLQIHYCPKMESFPQGLLQQRLSALQCLEIYGCPDLLRRCRSEGDYHHLIYVIPDLTLAS